MIKQLIKRIAILNLIFELIIIMHRIIYIFYFYDLSDLTPYTTLIKAFFIGIIYDCVVLIFINFLVAIIFIIFLIINNQKLFIKFIKSLKYYYITFWSFLIFLWCIDFGFFIYFKRHINYLLVEFFNHKISYLWFISKQEHFIFLVLVLIALILTTGIFLISKYILEKNLGKYVINKKNKNLFIYLTFIIIFFISSLIYVINFKFPNQIDSFEKFINVKLKIEHCISDVIETNPIFTFYITIREIKNSNINWIKKFSYDKDISLAFKDFFGSDKFMLNNPMEALSKTTEYNKNIEKIKPNVIFIVMESFGLDLLKHNNKDLDLLGELQKHFDEDIVFYNCLFSYENTLSSIETMMTSLLKRPRNAGFFKDNFETALSFDKKFYFTEIYKNKNYITTNISSTIPIPLSFDRNITDFLFDEQIYEKIFSVLDSNFNLNPNFIFCCTITNHGPFYLPSNCEVKKYKKDNEIKDISDLEITAYKYSCQQLGEFLTKLKKSKYADNTIVLAVGDHYTRNGEIADDLTLQSVPLYLYIPEKLKPAKELIDTTRVVSHLDVMPTLYELSLSSVTYYSLGQNIFDKNYQTAISSNYANAKIVNKENMCIYDVFIDSIDYYKLQKEKGNFITYTKTKANSQHKKILQQYKAGIVITEYLLNNQKKKKEDNLIKN